MRTHLDCAPPPAARFCRVLADARLARLRGWWDGSAYRSHPCGVFRDRLLLANHWNTHDYCHAEFYLDPAAVPGPRCYDSRCDGDPYPKPTIGTAERIYSDGRWVGPPGPWRDALVAIVDRLEVELNLWRIGKRALAADAARTAAHAQAVKKATMLRAWSR